MTRRVLRAVVADDEPLARMRLERLLGGMRQLHVVAVCASARQAVDAVRRTQPDVLFLDIRMPDATGFDVLAALEEHRPHVVFVTAHAEHAVSAFDAQAVDYLLKPYAEDRLGAAVDRVRARIGEHEASIAERSGEDDGKPPAYLTRLSVTVGRRIRMLHVDQIDLARAQANYVELHVGDRSYLLRGAIADLAQRLDPEQFVRVHRSMIVRVAAVESLESCGGAQYVLHLRDGRVVRSGRSYRDSVRTVFGLA